MVAVDYFTRWVEVELLACVKISNIKGFIWKFIICRFGVPRAITADNRPQSDCRSFENFREKWRINLKFTVVAHSKSNGQVEAINMAILNALKKKIEGKKRMWTEGMPEIL